MNSQVENLLQRFWDTYKALPKTEDLAKKFDTSQEEAEEWKRQFKASVLEVPPSTTTPRTSRKPRLKKSISVVEPSPSPVPSKMEASRSRASLFDWHELLTTGLIKSLWSIFALFCTYRSFDYVYSWFSRMDSWLNAVVAAILCTGATFLLPSTMALSIRGGKKHLGSSIGMGFLFLIFMVVTVNSTVGSLYETSRERNTHAESQGSRQEQNKARMAQLDSMIAEAKTEATALRAELAQRLEVQRSYAVGSKEYDRLAGNINTVKTRQDRNSALLAGFQDELGKLTTSTVAINQRASYASWWDNLLGWSPGTFDLVFGMAFAIALDISGPVALLISFFLGEKREDKN